VCELEFPMSGNSRLEINDIPGAILLTMSLPDEDRPPIVCALEARDVGFLIEALIGHGQGAFTVDEDE
jgi:hypothetical protein